MEQWEKECINRCWEEIETPHRKTYVPKEAYMKRQKHKTAYKNVFFRGLHGTIKIFV